MATIFISGSRAIPYLPEDAKERLDRIVQGAHKVVIGDSDKGVDAMIASYLASNQYDRVTVYTTRMQPRLKSILPSWKTVTIKVGIEKKSNAKGEIVNQRDIETEKDKAMGEIADFGFVIWKPEYISRFGNLCVSKGSLRNMMQLLCMSKPVVLYVYDDLDGAFRLVEMKSIEDLEKIVAKLPLSVHRSFGMLLKEIETSDHPTLF